MEIIDRYKEEIVKRLGDNLEALILVGSFSRGEGIEGLSDIEFVGIVKKMKRLDSRFCGNDSKGCENDISIKFTTRNHLKRLKPYIFTIELKKYGKVLWGEKKILELLPDYSYDDIDPKDGFVLLNNRIVDQLIVWQKASSGQSVRNYDIVKGYIQLVNSYLAVKRTYKSLYSEKQEEFNRVYKDNSYLKNKVNDAFIFLKKMDSRFRGNDSKGYGNDSRESGIDRKEYGNDLSIMLGSYEALRQWQELRNCYRQMWEEQVRISVESTSFIDRIKGWVKVLVDSQKRLLFSFDEIAGNLFMISPQFLIYRYAVREYFSDKQNSFNISRIIKQWEVIVK